jgi:acetylornithine deacetylase
MNGIGTQDALAQCKAILADLVAFPTVTGTSTRAIASYVSDYLARYGVTAHLDVSPDGQAANLFATIGAARDGGVILSGHFDVVPATPEGWTSDPFRLRSDGGKLYGRGAVDMKGFLAVALAAVPAFARRANELDRPLHLAFTYDEEIGSFGAHQLLPYLRILPFRPGIAIVGEPTGMIPIAGHKGGIELISEVTGRGGHASIPRNGVNAIYAASRFIAFLEQHAERLASQPHAGSRFNPPFTTISVGRIEGGEARNIIPRTCRVLWEVRPVPEEDVDALMALLLAAADAIDRGLKLQDAEAGLKVVEEARYPGLDPAQAGPALTLVQDLWGSQSPEVVSFGTDGGYFASAGISTLVFGPGSMQQAHQPDEFIAEAALAKGLDFLDRLLEKLCGSGR